MDTHVLQDTYSQSSLNYDFTHTLFNEVTIFNELMRSVAHVVVNMPWLSTVHHSVHSFIEKVVFSMTKTEVIIFISKSVKLA